MPDRPNILFFFTDDQRFDALGAAGNPVVQTPHLDRLVAGGVTFTHAHIMGGTCGAICMPSRAMLHTGRGLFHLEGEGQEILEEHALLGETLRRAGYATHGIGKWHNGRRAFARSFTGGNEIFFGGMNDHWNVPVYQYDPTGRYEARCPFVPDFALSNRVEYRPCDHVRAGVHSTDLFTNAAIEFLQNRPMDQPFFLYVSLMAPHDPRTMPERFRALYDPEAIPLPENFAPEHPIDTGALRIRDEMLAGFPRTPQEIRRHLAEYYAMVSHLDEGLGQLLGKLDEQGLRDNTIVVFAGDNGLAVGQHGLMGKQNLYDHSVRVPLVMAGPRVPAGVRSGVLAYLLDVFPTICELAGIDCPGTVEGASLVPCFGDASQGVREELYLAYEGGIRGIRHGRHKLIEYAGGETQLFDLEADPHERTNLALLPRSANLLAPLRARLLALRDRCDDCAHPCGRAFWAKRAGLDS